MIKARAPAIFMGQCNSCQILKRGEYPSRNAVKRNIYIYGPVGTNRQTLAQERLCLWVRKKQKVKWMKWNVSIIHALFIWGVFSRESEAILLWICVRMHSPNRWGVQPVAFNNVFTVRDTFKVISNNAFIHHSLYKRLTFFINKWSYETGKDYFIPSCAEYYNELV